LYRRSVLGYPVNGRLFANRKTHRAIFDHKQAEGIMIRRLIVVDGPLAWRMRRFQAAQANEVGLEVLTLPLLASRLAGGFSHLADRETLNTCVARALQDAGFAQLEDVRGLPGMVRAALQTLERAWTADIDLDARASNSPRIADIALLQRRVRDALPQGAMLPPQLRDAALDRIRFAPKLFGPVTLENVVDVEPVWRPLLIALARQLDVRWIAVGDADRSWFPGRLLPSVPHLPRNMRGELCSDPRAEVVEALRWTRELLSRGNVLARDIAITAASPSAWDEHVGRNNAIRVASGGPRERIARLSPDAGVDLSSYLEHRRDLFGLGSDALFASSRGRRERLPLRSIAQVIQMQIEDAGLTDQICPADLARYPVAKLISEGAGPQDAIVMVGYKRVPGVSDETTPSGSDVLKAFHPLHS
jgi:hypothetical protein